MCNSAPKLSIFAPAKVNLHLAVLDKRKDGFHNLESIFMALNFGDFLHFELLDCEDETDIIMTGQVVNDIPKEQNIIFKALSLFSEKTGFDRRFKITVEKRIPLGGGLGGGSSDAAATLLALNELAGYPLGQGCLLPEQLLDIACTLGSDVPFFMHRTPAALVTGRGERIQPIEAPDWHFVLVNAGFASDTAVAFRLLDEKRKSLSANEDKGVGSREWGVGIAVRNLSELITSNDDEQKPLSLVPCPLSLIQSPVPTPQSLLFNDFLPVFPEPVKSTYDQIISKLLALGARYANLSGSGSTCFGVFSTKEQAEKAALSLNGQTCEIYKYSHSE